MAPLPGERKPGKSVGEPGSGPLGQSCLLVCRPDYNLTAGRYKPWEEGKEDPADSSPMELLEKLSRMEQDSAKKIQELIEMTKAYG